MKIYKIYRNNQYNRYKIKIKIFMMYNKKIKNYY